MIKKRSNLLAYTLSEIVVVMLIISVVVAVTIGVTKKKLESTTSYTYYSAYEALKDVTRTMLTDFNPQNTKYQAKLPENHLYESVYQTRYRNMLRSLWELPAEAGNLPQVTDFNDCVKANCWHGSETYFECLNRCKEFGKVEGCLKTCPEGQILVNSDSPDCYCTEAVIDPPTIDPGLMCFGNKIWDDTLQKCVCKTTCGIGYRQNESTCECESISFPVEPDEPETGCSAGDTPPSCGQECVDGQWQAIAGFSKNCDEYTQEWRDLPDCKCVPVARTIPLKGENFCEEFERRVNTNSGDDYCKGTTISSSDKDFSNKTPDLVLRNGIMIYNLHSNPQKLSELEGNKSGFTVSLASKNLNIDFGEFNKDNVIIIDKLGFNPVNHFIYSRLTLYPLLSSLFNQQAYADIPPSGWSGGGIIEDPFAPVDTGEYGYVVYVDIDGKKGTSTLWDDVFPFYITLSGQVVPAYTTDDGSDLGGNNNAYLQTSVQYEKISAQGRRKIDWLLKSVSFKEGACKSGFLNSSTPYCSGIGKLSQCNTTASGEKCSLKIVKPVKFF